MNANSFITLTFGDMAENHIGMEQIGKLVNVGNGFNFADLSLFKQNMEKIGCICELTKLDLINTPVDDAFVLIIRNGVNKILEKCSMFNENNMFSEQIKLNMDKHAFMYGRVVNKLARWNLCFDYESRPPDYVNGKGTIIGYNDVPITKTLYEQFPLYFGEKSRNLKGEGNYYYNVDKCGIGFHGDSERRKVIAVRLGNNSKPLHYQWFKNDTHVGEQMVLNINAGDIYIMSEKAVGTDWKNRNIYTLRHATGCSKYTKI
jgi:hypothetical protein